MGVTVASDVCVAVGVWVRVAVGVTVRVGVTVGVGVAGVTRGALYHQYADKRDLFRAVFESVEQQLGQKMAMAAAATTDPGEQLLVGTRAFLEAALDPPVRRIVLLDGPSVLGWEEWRRIDSQYAFGLVRAVWEANVAAGKVPALPLDSLTELMLGALNASALAVAAAPDPHAAIAEFVAVIEAVREGFRLVAQSRRRAPAEARGKRTRPRPATSGAKVRQPRARR